MPELQTILKLKVPVIVQIGRRGMSMEDVLALQPGAILELDKHADDELSLLINNKHVGAGTAVKVGENFGIRVTQAGSARQRIQALAEDGEQPENAGQEQPSDATGSEHADGQGESTQQPAEQAAQT